MKKLLLLVSIPLMLISCKTGKQTEPSKVDTVKVGIIDSPKAITDTVVVEVPTVFDSTEIKKEQRKVLEAEYIKVHKSNDSLKTIDVKIEHQLKQYKETQKLAKDYTTQAVNKKLSNAWLKTKMRETIGKPVTKYSGKDVESERLLYGDKTDDEVIRLLKPEISILIADNLKLIQGNKAKSTELLHKKMIHTNALFYLNITIRNSSQDKFLKGWMRRAFSQ